MAPMRALLAALSILLALVTLAPHVHPDLHGAEGCSVCVAGGRHAEPAWWPAPDAAPKAFALAAPVLVPGLAPVLGPPLGAIPGQSPPRG